MAVRTRLEAWLKGSYLCERKTDLFEMAVAQGLAAQESVTATLRDAFLLDEPEVPPWLKAWVAKLSNEEIAAIKAGRDAEQVMLREHIDRLFVDDPEQWTETERGRATELSQRLAAVNLVLRARDEMATEEEELDKTIFLPVVDEAMA